jgi:hypothetical protein
MPIELLYLVVASSGRYDFYYKWVVAAFPTLEAAVEYRDLASKASQEAIEEYKRSPDNEGMSYVYFDAPTKYDLGHSVRGTAVTYRIETLPFVKGMLPSMGLMSIADQVSSAEAVVREINNPGITERMGLSAPQPAVEVKSDFADKLKAVLPR